MAKNNNFLLDTHILLWWMNDDSQLTQDHRQIIVDSSHNIYISIASLWEITIKQSLGKLKLSGDLYQAIKTNNFSILPIEPDHLQYLAKLPFHHRDPFDRMLVSQATVEDLQLITDDKKIFEYLAD